jgi:elongation factor 1-gamma
LLKVAKKSSKATQLLGATDEEQALVDQWLSFAQTEVHANAGAVLVMLRGMVPYTKPVSTVFVSPYLLV